MGALQKHDSILSEVYTLLISLLSKGGIKAVIWTDTLQAIVMVAGILAVTVKGTMKVGSFEEVLSIARAGDRLSIK